VSQHTHSYWDSVVGKVNRHRLVAFFVCAPASWLALRILAHGPVTPAAALKVVLFAVAAYSGGSAAVSAWPSKRKQALAGDVPPTALQVGLFRGLSVLCALLASLAAFGVWLVIHNA
jgi:hypothetical protein